ncbi:MAG: DinB family protein [Longimicrobiales bacterium]
MPSPRVAAGAALLAAAALATPLAAQHTDHAVMPESGLRAELIRDIDQLEQKYVALAEAMSGKYDWRPSEGVRSVGEVFMHVAGANFMLPSMVGVEPPEELRAADMQGAMARMQELEQMTDETEMREMLRHSFMHAKHSIASVPDGELESMIKLFGHDATKRAALTMLVSHMHEHLGQSIAYARSNGVVPPWSAGGE